jgi:internalin A
MGIEGNAYLSDNLRSLEGCPDRLKKLYIGYAPHLSDLSPLASCSIMEELLIDDSYITDISVVASMPLLEAFVCRKMQGRPSIKDLSPLTSCRRLKKLWLYGNEEVEDISPISACTSLEDLELTDCPLITSLAPLSNLENLQILDCRFIDPQTSFLPLASCTGLKELQCNTEAVDLEELRNRRPQLKI